MWIVRIALSRPYTFIVLALLILILGTVTILRTPVDIFPNIDIPVVSVVFNYSGLPPDEMGTRIAATFERVLSTVVNDVEHVESQSLLGVSVVKIFFQPHVDIELSLSQVVAIAQTMLRALPPGMTPPLILNYNASTVPVIQIALSSSTMAEQDIFDFANSFMRMQLVSVPGAALPFPFGGKQRQVAVDLNQQALQARGLSAQDVSNAITSQNLIIPAGSEKIGMYEYNIKLNSSPKVVEELNDLPVKQANGTVVYVRDVAHVRDGFAPQINIVNVNGVRAVLMTIQKTGTSSTLDIISGVKALIPKIKDSIPPGLHLTTIGDQSLFVLAAVHSVIREGVLAAILTGLMILLFLGSWRSTLIITISIPLSVLVSIIMLSALGETINIMTLGGLALAVGILVDDATVAIENINWHLEQGKEVEEAILDGAQQIAVPALVSTLCICIVFVPMFFLQGIAHYLFLPLAEAVIFAMLASYILSRTLIPTLAKYWLRKHEHNALTEHDKPANIFIKIQQSFEDNFVKFRQSYFALLEAAIRHRKGFIISFLAFVVISIIVFVPWLGSDFFPRIDGGQIKLHIRTHTGTRVEETAKLAAQIDDSIRKIIPPSELEGLVDNVGLPFSGINLSYSTSAPVSSADADIFITLNAKHHSIFEYTRQMRKILTAQFPGVTFAFLPADIVSQILNFGLPSPIDVQVMGFNTEDARHVANDIYKKIRQIPGMVDCRIQQQFDDPEFRVDVDRSRAQELGLTQKDVASNVLITLSGSFQNQPTFWLSPKGVSYNIVTQTPQYNFSTLQQLINLPITGPDNKHPQILGALATITRGVGPAVASHYNVQSVIDIFGAVQDTDLGSVAKQIDKIIAAEKAHLPKGISVIPRGQMITMTTSFHDLFGGLIFAIVLVYLLIVVNFQSWTDPFIIIMALPGAIAGIVWMLFFTHTSLSVPALIGSIMCMGVATANSILVVSFARERMSLGDDAVTATLAAGFTRLRPVMMTALAMIIGMIPMALALGEGGEQNAPLGRAVIGGLIFATLATLFFVPSVFCFIHSRREEKKNGHH